MKNLLLLKGGGAQEHEVSLVTAQYLKTIIDSKKFKIFEVEVDKNFDWFCETQKVELNFARELVLSPGNKVPMDLCVPCFHGFPGETGHIQAYFEMINLPFLGCGYEASAICFNKVLTKLWLEKANIPVTPFLIAKDCEEKTFARAESFFDRHQSLFVKASNQGSSVGCFPVDNKKELPAKLKEAFNYSNFVILEKKLTPRELEISVFERGNELIATRPCEIICPDKFYSYDEKYSQESKTRTILNPEMEEVHVEKIREYALAAFQNLKLSQFCRMDFFLENGEIYLNEINTFPGMTPISMFPKMIENHGFSYPEILNEHLDSLIK